MDIRNINFFYLLRLYVQERHTIFQLLLNTILKFLNNQKIPKLNIVASMS